MRLDAEHYREAAHERLEDAQVLHEQGRYSFAIYTAGRSAECLLRALALRESPHLEAGHDLRILAQRSRLMESLDESARVRSNRALLYLFSVWDNNLRYCGTHRLAAHLKRRGLLAGIRGNAVKYNSSCAIQAARVIVEAGERIWR